MGCTLLEIADRTTGEVVSVALGCKATSESGPNDMRLEAAGFQEVPMEQSKSDALVPRADRTFHSIEGSYAGELVGFWSRVLLENGGGTVGTVEQFEAANVTGVDTENIARLPASRSMPPLSSLTSRVGFHRAA